MNTNDDDDTENGMWRELLDIAEPDLVPRPEFEARLRDQIGSTWDELEWVELELPEEAQHLGTRPHSGESGSSADSPDHAHPTLAAPVPQPQRGHTHDENPSALGAPGRPARSGGRARLGRHGAFGRREWARLGAVAAGTLLLAGTALVLSRNSRSGDLIESSSDIAESQPLAILSTTTIPELATAEADDDMIFLDPTDGTDELVSTEATAPSALIDPPDAAMSGDERAAADDGASTGEPDHIFDGWPQSPPRTGGGVTEFQHYLPTEDPAGSARLVQSAFDPIYEDAEIESPYVQTFEYQQGLIVVSTTRPTGFRADGPALPDNPATADWATPWPVAEQALVDADLSYYLEADDGYVKVNAVGVDDASLDGLISQMVRSDSELPGWKLPGATPVAEGWSSGGLHRALWTDSVGNPLAQIEMGGAAIEMFPWMPTTDVFPVEVGDLIGAAASFPAEAASTNTDDVVAVSWITREGDGVRIVYRGSVDDAVKFAALVRPVSYEDWSARMDGTDNRVDGVFAEPDEPLPPLDDEGDCGWLTCYLM